MLLKLYTLQRLCNRHCKYAFFLSTFRHVKGQKYNVVAGHKIIKASLIFKCIVLFNDDLNSLSNYFQQGPITYEITKVVDPSVKVTVGVTITSAPIPGVQPVSIITRIKEANIMFSKNTTVT